MSLPLAQMTGSLRDLVLQVREYLFVQPDGVCLQRARLVTEAWQAHEQEPPPLRQAYAFAHVLRHMDLDLTSNPIFAGNTSARPHAAMLIPEQGLELSAQVKLETPGVQEGFEAGIPDDLRDFWRGRSFGGVCAIGHLSVNMPRVVHEGLEAMLAECRLHSDEEDAARAVYREAMAVSVQAVIDWAGRYAEAAREAAVATDDPLRAACLTRVAEACERVPARPARNLFEGLQAMILVHLATAIEGHGYSIAPGLVDRILAPFIGADLDAEESTALAAGFLLKMTANSVFGRGAKTQTVTLGGANAVGEDCCNALTRCFLDAADMVRVGDPQVFLRYHGGLDPSVSAQAARMLADGLSMPLLINDEPTIRGLTGLGITPDDASEYCVIGCNELGIPGCAFRIATGLDGQVHHAALLRETLLGLADPDALESMAELLAALEPVMLSQLREMRGHGRRHVAAMAESVPTPFTSALMDGCVARGEDLLTGMVYQNPGLYERGFSNAVDGLAAIEELVWRERSVRLSEIVAALRDDFEDEGFRQRLLRCPRWGAGDERADRLAGQLLALRERVLGQLDGEFEHAPHSVCHVVRSLHHLDGRWHGATPDGRRAGEPLADSIGATTGSASAGATGVLDSVRKIDAARYYRGGYNLNVTLPTGLPAERVGNLIETFFEQGGQELQINALCADTLRDAQRRPEQYRGLVVRVAGFSARFIDLSPLEQEELVARAERAAVGPPNQPVPSAHPHADHRRDRACPTTPRSTPERTANGRPGSMVG